LGGKNFKEGRFAAAIGPEKGKNFRMANSKANLVQRLPSAVSVRNGADINRWN
jgi:hypothetical protein